MILLIVAIGVVVAAGTYLLTDRSLSRSVIGLSLIGHATVLGLLVGSRDLGLAPIVAATAAAPVADPLPQALALTAIVISFSVTVFVLAMAARLSPLEVAASSPEDVEPVAPAELGEVAA